MKETIKNLSKAFIGESMARNRYTMYSKIARNEGFEQIAEIFLITADNEREHATWIMRMINQIKAKNSGKFDDVVVDGAEVPNVLGTTAQNLKAAIAGENFEHTKMYPEFAKIAEREGLLDIATRIKAISKAEEHHEERYLKILKEVENGTVLKKDKEIWWVCRECGYVHFGKTPPDKCPSCDHEESFYQRKCEEY